MNENPCDRCGYESGDFIPDANTRICLLCAREIYGYRSRATAEVVRNAWNRSEWPDHFPTDAEWDSLTNIERLALMAFARRIVNE